MADWNDPRGTRQGFGASPSLNGEVVGAGGTVMDAGLRKHMLSVYNYMTSGVLLTAIVALLFVNSSFYELLYARVMTAQGVIEQPTMLGWIVIFSPLAIVFGMSFGAARLSESTLKGMFWAYVVLIGLSLSSLLKIYTGASLAATFFAASAAFGGMSLFGYTTKKDISGWGSFLIMGVIGLIVTTLLNVIFFKSVGLDMAVSAIGVLIFAGLTAWRTQMIKGEYYELRGTPWIGKAAILSALSLYISFINMFLYLLRFMGNARN
ncbi:MAG: Bax inhibitor-1/YccA family protein [Sphingomonadales bacterium]|nr:Bax inhibitor-1/YccA family protein [Sphingomonadales bacterium]MBD3773566.1 Bax inhibitor-1/YccA family protein [Paracoccaceae bacterium]